MTGPTTSSGAAGNVWQSIGAVVAGLVAVFAFSLGTDQLLRVLNVYPPWGVPMFDPRLNFLALAYRTAYDVLGCYLAARLAPRNPMRHALLLGGIGFGLATLGAIGAIIIGNLGPLWYPVSLVVTALPSAWLGGRLAERRDA